MYIRIAERHPVGDHSIAGWEWDRPDAHLKGVCCKDVEDLQDWAERCWPYLESIGYDRAMLESREIRVWIVEGPIAEGEYDADADIVIAESAQDVTEQVLRLL